MATKHEREFMAAASALGIENISIDRRKVCPVLAGTYRGKAVKRSIPHDGNYSWRLMANWKSQLAREIGATRRGV